MNIEPVIKRRSTSSPVRYQHKHRSLSTFHGGSLVKNSSTLVVQGTVFLATTVPVVLALSYLSSYRDLSKSPSVLYYLVSTCSTLYLTTLHTTWGRRGDNGPQPSQ